MGFIHSSKFTQTTTNSNPSFQRSVKSLLNRHNTIIPKYKKCQLTSLNPESLQMKAFTDSTNTLIRPVINCHKARPYRTAKFITKSFNNILYLPYMFNVCNSMKSIEELKSIERHPIRLCFLTSATRNLIFPSKT